MPFFTGYDVIKEATSGSLGMNGTCVKKDMYWTAIDSEMTPSPSLFGTNSF